MQALKLIALDKEDLQILSAHMQDAVMRVDDIVYLPSQKRFAAIANRFNWEKSLKNENGAKEDEKDYERRRAALRFERVLGAQIQNIELDAKDTVLELLTIQYEESAEPPTGDIILVFSGGAAIRLEVECIEAELKDLGAAWRTKSKPEHTEAEDG